MYLMAIVVPIFTSAQVLKIWVNQNAGGVSLIAWVTYLINSFMWVIYGIIRKECPVVFNNSICFLINLSVVIGAIIYR